MPDVDWVREYIHKLFHGDIDKQGVAIRNSKLDYINLPLYKYCYVCEEAARSQSTIDYNINNFEKDLLFFQRPNCFNDPFDCFLGFSQSQVIRDLLTQELKRKKQLTPQNRKAIGALFNEKGDSMDMHSIPREDLKTAIEKFLPLILDDDPLKQVFEEVFYFIYDQDNDMLKKLITNTLTIRDKQNIVDLVYCNSAFQEYIKSKCNPDYLDSILKIAPHDMKIKIENDPDSFMSDNSGETLGIFDFIRMFSGMLGNNKFSSEEIDNVKLKFNEISNDVLEKSRVLISKQFRVTCLSERMNSPLMWSHYANKHYGFCLEYDFTSTITEMRYPDLFSAQLMLFPVCYSERRPLLSKALFGSTAFQYVKTKQLPPDFLEKLMYGLLCKSEDWAYEKEWRIFQLLSDIPTMRLPKARKVFLGVNMEDTAKNRVIQIAQKKHIPVFQMFLRSDKYQFDYFQVK